MVCIIDDRAPVKAECIDAVVWLEADPGLYVLAHCEGYVPRRRAYLCTINGVDNFAVAAGKIRVARANRAVQYWRGRAMAAERAAYPGAIGEDQSAAWVMVRSLEGEV